MGWWALHGGAKKSGLRKSLLGGTEGILLANFFFLGDEETEEERKENLPQCKRMSVTGLGFEPKPHE